jgi:Ca2+-binding RTX toxin-like protein
MRLTDILFGRRHLRNTARPRKARRSPASGVEQLENRVVLAADIGFDPAARTLTIVGTEGNDTVEVRQQGSSVVVSMDSGSGMVSRTVRASAVRQIVFSGLDGNDSFTNLTAVASRADGGAGDDVLRGGRAADVLVGGDGQDQLMGNVGNDQLDGGNGDDAVWGGVGNDRVMGGSGDDRLYGEAGADAVWGGDGADSLDGGVGNDTLYGEAGNDQLMGAAGIDMLAAGGGNDMLMGGAGNDTLEAGDGSDTLDGQGGSDRLVGGSGVDRELDVQDRLSDGDADGDGFDDEWVSLDPFDQASLFGYGDRNDPVYGETVGSVDASVRELLGIPASDSGLQVLGASFTYEGRNFGFGIWRYRTADGMAVSGSWNKIDTQLDVFYGPTPNLSAQVDYRDFLAEKPFVQVTWNRDETATFYIDFPANPADGFIDRVRTELGFVQGLAFSTVTNRPGTQSLRVEGTFAGTTGLPPLPRIFEVVRGLERISRASEAVNPTPSAV